MRVLMVVLCGLAASCLQAQSVLKAWEFNRDGDTEGWLPAHSLAPFVVEGGVLKTHVTGGDPYMHSSAGQSFDLQANDFQYLEIRLKSDQGTAGEFFWANTVEGKDAGFVAGKERVFACLPDNQWHVYRVYPLWQGQVTRLRLDPPGEETGNLEMDYIRIVQGPVSTHDPKSPAWDFTKGNGGWIAQSGGALLAETPQGAQTELTAEAVTLTGPIVDLNAADYRYAHVELDADGDLSGGLYWSSTDDANFPGCNVASFDVPKGRFAANLRLADNPMYAGQIKRLQLSLAGKAGTKVALRQVALSPNPLGPAKLKVVSFAADSALAIIGREGRLVARLENAGGEPTREATLTASVVEGPAQLAGPATQTLKPIAPGGTGEVVWAFRAIGEGRARFALQAPEEATAEAEVVVSKPFPIFTATAQPAAQAAESAAWIGNDKVLLTVVKGADGFSCGRLDAVEKGKARSMAFLPHLASLAIAGTEGFSDLPLQAARATSGADGAVLTLTGTKKIGPATAAYSIRFGLRSGKSYLETTYELSADRDLQVAAFRGPWLWAGEGSFGGEQDTALFPGLEYLVKGERSSSTLDIAPPGNVRFAPHPNSVTIPSMAIEKDGAIVGLMWDPLQKWDGVHQKPTAIFASPNFVEKHANHLLGLYLPAIPNWVKPNELRAEKPYELKKSKRLTLTACLYAEAQADVLRSLDLYFDRYGLPELPPKPRSYEDTIVMSLKCYENILWAEKAKGWMPVVGWAPGASQDVALDYVLGARRAKDRAWAEKLTAKGLSLASPSDLAFNLHQFGRPGEPLANLLGDGRARALQAPADGKYTFEPDTNQLKSLGAAGSTAVGICARDVRPLLADALLTGDRAPLEAALKTLRFMEQFKVPRASQVWEVPVHTPDILAAGDACDVYLMAYKLTGDRHLLEQAAFWAKTGLPFVYQWQAPEEKPFMKGASIAVFGASFYVGSWFARPVQWNGLAYASALLELAKYDHSLPWRHFGEMITLAGMNMQSTREKDYGAYTDNWGVIDGAECVGCMLSPGGILNNVMELVGAPGGMRTETVLDAGKPICITAAPVVSDAKLDEGALRFALRYDAGQTAFTAVMPIAEPTAVEVEGAKLARAVGAILGAEGWSYREGLGCLTIKLKFGDAARQVRIVGAKVTQPELPVPDWEFNTDGDTEGWEAAHDVAPLTTQGGNLIVNVTGGDPYLVGPGIGVPAGDFAGFVFRARATAPGGEVFFGNDKGGPSPLRERAFQLPADGQFHEVKVDLRDHPEWSGTITRLRLDFAGPPCQVEIDWIRMLKR